MIIELSGIDGSGKTTLLEHIQGYFSSHKVPCVERPMRSTYKRVLADTARRAGFGHWKQYFGVNEVELAHALEMLTLVSSSISVLDHSYQVVVTDTYVRRWLATAQMWGATNLPQIAAVLRHMPIPDLSLHLDTDPSTARQRLEGRAKRDHPTKLFNPTLLSDYATAFGRIEQIMHYPTMVISTHGPLELTLERLLPILEDWHQKISQASSGPRTDATT